VWREAPGVAFRGGIEAKAPRAISLARPRERVSAGADDKRRWLLPRRLDEIGRRRTDARMLDGPVALFAQRGDELKCRLFIATASPLEPTV
jgi:hypothetical protein